MTPETHIPAYPTSPLVLSLQKDPPLPRWERVGACPVLDTGVTMTPVISDLIRNPPSTPPVDSRFRGKDGGSERTAPFILSAPPRSS